MKSGRIKVVAATVAAVLAIGLLIVPHLLNADTYRGRVETALSESLGRHVELGHLGFSLFSGSLVADGLSIADDAAFSSQPFLTAKTIHIGVETGPLLLHRELHVTGLTIDGPAIALLRKQDGTWNYSSLGGKRTAHAQSNTLMPNLTVGHMDIEDGTLTVDTLPAQGPPRMFSEVKVSAQNFSLVSAFPYTVSAKLPAGGSLDASGTAGPIDRRDASLTPLTAQVSLKHADLVGAGLVDAGQGVAGVADLDAKIASNGQSAQADGTLHLTQVKLAKNGSPSSQPLDVDFSVEQNLQTLSGKIARANVRVGKAAVAVTGDYTTRGNITTVQMKANGQGIPIDDLVAFLPSLGVQLPAGSRLRGGLLAMSLAVSGPTAALVISGPVRVANTQLAGFNLGQKLASVEALTGAKTGSDTTIQELSTDLHYGPDGTRTDNLRAVVDGLGSAAGSGSISPGGALNYHLVLKLGGGGGTAAQPLSLLAGALGTGVLGTAVGSTMKNGIAVTIAGTTSNPTFTPDMGKMVSGAIPGKSQAPASLGKTLSGLFHHP